MNDLLTHWGYRIKGTETLGDLLTNVEYNELTAGKYAGDTRIASDIAAASSAIRNYCGWHIAPSLQCELSTTFFDKRVGRKGAAVLIQLPARFVSAIESVKIDGISYTSFVFETNGLLKVYGVEPYPEWTPIVVEYTAGLTSELLRGIKELVAHRVTHALASSEGVQSEAAGGVSITYSANWTNSARATALTDDNKEVLAPFRLQGVF